MAKYVIPNANTLERWFYLPVSKFKNLTFKELVNYKPEDPYNLDHNRANPWLLLKRSHFLNYKVNNDMPRDLFGPFRFLRRLLKMKNYQHVTRFENELAPRSIPPPNVPYGPNHRLAANYYYTRDARRQIKPTKSITNSQAFLESAKQSTSEMKYLGKVPGENKQNLGL